MKTSRYGPQNAWPDDGRASGQRRITGDNVQRIAGLQLHDGRELPSLNRPIAAKWQSVNPAYYEPVARVKVRQATTIADIITILYDEGSR